MVAGAQTGNQVFTRSGGVPIPISYSGTPNVWAIKITKTTSPFNVLLVYARSINSTTVVIDGNLAPVGPSGSIWTFQFLAFDWNNQNNWYTSLATKSACCCSVNPGNLLGRLPNPALGDTVILVGSGYSANTTASNIVNGPSGTYSGPIGWNSAADYGGGYVTLNAGTYSGAISLNINNYYQFGGIGGGTYSGAVTLSNAGWISGGTFTGTVTRACGTTVPTGPGNVIWYFSTGIPVGRITGGTYSPSATIALTKPLNTVNSGYPNDPGFAAGGGVFSPNVVITGVGSDILGAGLP